MKTFAEAIFSVIVTPSEVKGQWVAHCLNIDLVTQGDSVQHAFAMALESVRTVVADDLKQGLDPLDRKEAPEECWKLMNETVRHGQPMSTVEDLSRIRVAVGQIAIRVPAEALPAESRPEDDLFAEAEVGMMPPIWQMAALNDLRNSQRSIPCH